MEINFSEMIWTIINFIVLLAILNKFLYKPLMNMLEKRSEEIAGNLSSASAAKDEAQAMLVQYRQQLEEARQEAQNLVNKAIKIGEDTRNQMLTQAREEAGELLVKAKQEIQAEKQHALASIRDEVATLALLAAGKVIERNLTTEDNQRLVEQFVAGMGTVQ